MSGRLDVLDRLHLAAVLDLMCYESNLHWAWGYDAFLAEHWLVRFPFPQKLGDARKL